LNEDLRYQANAPIRINKKSNNVLDISFDVVKQGWEKWFMLRSDAHHDGARNNRKLEIEHLEMAVERDAHILDFGDLHDCMGGRYDPRKQWSDMRPEYFEQMAKYQKSYFNVISDDAVNFYKPYADRWALQGIGNHEVSVAKNSDVNLIDLFVKGMQDAGGVINKGGYGGWVRFHFKIGGTQNETVNLKYFHGSGGGGPVTKGVIQSNRQAVFLPDAQIVVNGHIHESWVLSLPRERITSQGIIKQDLQYHVRTPTYQDDYGDGSGGWHVERGAPPKPMGCVWLRFFYKNSHVEMEFTQSII
jgi:hypothetical protein